MSSDPQPPSEPNDRRDFDEFFRRSPRSMQMLASDGRTLAVNQAWERLWGISLADLDGYSVRDDPQLRDKGIGQLLERAFHGEPVELPAIEYRLQFGPATGERRWVRATATPLLDVQGDAARVVLVHEDVTDSVAAENALAKLLKAQRALAEAGRAFAEAESNISELLEATARHASAAIGDGCTVWLFDDAREHLRPAATFHPDPETDRFARAFLMEAGVASNDGMVARAAISGRPTFLPSLDPTTLRDRANPAYHELLTRFPAHGLMAAPMRTRGQTVGVIGVSRATPDRPYARDDLNLLQEFADRAALAIANARLSLDAQAAEKRYRGLFEGVADAILVADADRRVLESNRAAERMLGYSSAELRSMRADDLVVSETAWAQEQMTRFTTDGKWQGELGLRRKDGSVVPVETAATLVSLAGGPVVLSVARDIAERKRAERFQRDILAMVSHDLRGPLTSLRAHAQLLQRRQTYRAANAEAIIASADRMARLIDDLADVVSLEEGKLSLHRQRVDLLELARTQVETANAGLETAPVSLDPANVPVVGEWDPDRLAQVLHNLIGNALKYAGAGQIVVRVEAAGEDARCSVIDHGPGIPSEHLSRLFDRFYRADASGAGGLGLGLYISRMIVEAHGGRIWATSESGRGAAFSVVLPME